LLLSNPRVIARHYSPSISRSFTESMSEARLQAARTIPVPVALTWPKLLNEWLVVGFASGILLFMSISLGVQVSSQTQELARLRSMHEGIVEEIAHWQKITREHADYRDGYFRIALLQYQVGNEELARMNLEKSLNLDPNFAPGIAFKEKLNGEK
jgi:hypothetical protein